MKRTMKLFSLAVAVVMMVAMAIPAFAAGSTGTIEVTNATVGQKYTAYKILDATYSDSNVSYTIRDNSQWYNLVNNSGVFDLKAARTERDAATDKDVTTYYVTQKKDADVIKWMSGLDLTEKKAEGAETVATSDTVSWQVPFGYYLITSDLGNKAVTVDSNTPNVHIIDKNQTSSWGEGGKFIVVNGTEVNQNSVNYGDTVNFVIRSTAATSYNGDQMVTSYTVHDTMHSDMTLVGEPVVTVNGTTLTKGTDYTYTTNPTDDCTFEISIPWTKTVDGVVSPKYNSNNTIEVTYSATVNNDADLNKDLSNNAELSWTDASNREGHSVQSSTATYTYGLAIKKVNPAKTPLAGATFTVKQGDTLLKFTATDIPGVYDYDANGTVTEVVSPESGLIVLKGLASREYTLTETVAPDGYNLLSGPVYSNPSQIKSTIQTFTTYYDADGNVVDTEEKSTTTETKSMDISIVEIENYAGFELPSTGGMGTTLFYALGGMLMAGAVILLVTKKKVSNQG